jgi:hypothetical protein
MDYVSVAWQWVFPALGNLAFQTTSHIRSPLNQHNFNDIIIYEYIGTSSLEWLYAAQPIQAHKNIVTCLLKSLNN